MGGCPGGNPYIPPQVPSTYHAQPQLQSAWTQSHVSSHLAQPGLSSSNFSSSVSPQVQAPPSLVSNTMKHLGTQSED
eukprot:6936656-Karenia_brevis.AAC.1